MAEEKEEEKAQENSDNQKSKYIKIIKRVVQIVIAVLLLYLVFDLFWTETTLDTLRNVNVSFFILAIVFHLIALGVVAYRFKMLIEFKVKTTYKNVYWANLYGMLMGEVTPGKSGYFLCVLPLERKGIKKRISLSCLIIIQVMDFILRGAIGIFAVIYFTLYLQAIPLSESTWYIVISVGLIVLFLLGFYILMYTSLPVRFLKRFNIPYKEKMLNGLEILHDTRTATRGRIWEILILTVLAWVLTGFRWVFIGYAFGLDLPIIAYLLLQPLITLVSFIPITIGGLGLLEGGVVKALNLLGVSEGKALAFVLGDRVAVVAAEAAGIKEHKFK
ncbi:MAG: flippase-like domain-containing protein [Thermoplasmata archaeon]|nr:MAG: flippase-like domain-containing protein [Thermoplasmata archaeon]